MKEQNSKAESNSKQFWDWFLENQDNFWQIVNAKDRDKIEEEFLSQLAEKLAGLRQDIFYFTGMCSDSQAELILTADGYVNNITFIEDLIKAAPALKNWRFTALKPEMDANDLGIDIHGYVFEAEKMAFFSPIYPDFPDYVSIVVAYSDYKQEDHDDILNGVSLFIDNYLGELKSVSLIDNLQVCSFDQADHELIPIDKLKGYLQYRESEFVEKYQGTRYNTDQDMYSSLQGENPEGAVILAIVNKTLLSWDAKPSHPWMVEVVIDYDPIENGLPNKEDYQLIYDMEDSLALNLKDHEGYLYAARKVSDGSCSIFLPCKEFREVSRFLDKWIPNYQDCFTISYYIYKDKYWQSLNQFQTNEEN